MVVTTATNTSSGVGYTTNCSSESTVEVEYSSESTILIPTSIPTSSSSTTVTQCSSASSLSHHLSSSQLPGDIAKNKFEKPVQPEGITFPSQMSGTTSLIYLVHCISMA